MAVKGVRPGEGTGYGLRWTADRAADDRDRARRLRRRPRHAALGGRGVVLVRGRRVPIVGSVCMDMITIDVTGLDVSPGDDVVLIGRQGDDEITAREMAATIGTIPWEVVCRLGARIERRYGSS